MAQSAHVDFAFTVEGQGPETFSVAGFTGTVALSALYRFDVTLCAARPSVDLAALARKPARLRLSTFGDVRDIHGIVAEAAYLGERAGIGSHYRIVLVPRLWLLTLSRQHQVYGTEAPQSAVDILTAELTGNGMRGPAAAAAAGLTQADYELRLEGSYPERDHVVQHAESDFAFVSRLLEAQGIFYLFDQRDGGEVAVFADHNATFPDVEGEDVLAYRPAGGMVRGEPSVFRLSSRSRPLPKTVILKDYDYRLPRVPMQAEGSVDPSGTGVVVRYGDHFRTPEEGTRLARIRADALRCRQRVVSGVSDCVHVAAGRRLRFRDHPSAAFDGRFLVERVVHEGWDPAFGGRPSAGSGDAAGYVNRFEALDATRTYRPEARTPRPRSPGLSHARIDGAGDGARAELDSEGRYRVRLPWDLSDAPDGRASRPMRMMQPYGGGSQGTHFPLLKGTEVLLASIDGDPDRPIILGAAPNPAQPSQVTSANAVRNQLRTTSGIELEMNDGTVTGGSGRVAAGAGGILAPQRNLLDDDGLSEEISSTGSWAKLSVPDYDHDDDDSYLRLGIADDTAESGFVDNIGDVLGSGYSYDGMLASTDGGDTRVTAGSAADSVGGDVARVVDGDGTDSIAGSRSVTLGYGDSDDPGNDVLTVAGDARRVVGGDETVSIAGSATESVGGSYTRTTGARTDTLGRDLTVTVDGDYSLHVTGRVSESWGSSSLYASQHVLNAYGEVHSAYLDVEISFHMTFRARISSMYSRSIYGVSINTEIYYCSIDFIYIHYTTGWGTILSPITSRVVRLARYTGPKIKSGALWFWDCVVGASG